MDEPHSGLHRVLEWAERHTYSTVWSCLAAHAAVLQLDGIARKPLADKCCGVFESAIVSEHPLTSALAPRFGMPHSRWNGLSEGDLVSHGYRILSRSADAGVDAFVKQRDSLFVFFQSHTEYDAASLMLEYRRDVGRFLKGERETYPSMPRGYFGRGTAETLARLRERALANRCESLLADFDVDRLGADVAHSWRPEAVCLYRSWLQYVWTEKSRRIRSHRIQRAGRGFSPALSN